MPVEAGESFEADELWLFIGSKAQVFWLWLCVSYETGQVWAFDLGARDGDAATALMQQFFAHLPQELVHRVLIYTDGYAAYAPAIEAQLQQRGLRAWSDRVHRSRPKKERRLKARRRQAINKRRIEKGKSALRDPDLGATNTAEGINNGLRARCAPLVRRSQAFARDPDWFLLRLRWILHHKNKRIFQKHTQSDQ